ncbi:MAG: response regulator [Bacteroidota bacterium]|nr:response regulator [Bacteroidota bacterium]
MSDFYRCKRHQRIHFDIIAPLFDDNKRIRGAIVFRTDPSIYLFPLIQSWPTPSKSSETLIVRQFGDSVVYMNELRHQKNTVLKLRFSLDRKDIPAVQAVLGHEGVFEGKDYRDVEVLTVIKQVPRTPWYMIAKVDKSEVFSILDYKSAVVIIVLIFLFALGVMVLAWIYHYHQRNIYRNLYRNEKELSKSQLMLQKSQEIGRLGSWDYDLLNKSLKWSDEVYRILGYKPGSVEPAYDVFLETVHPDDRDHVDQVHQQSIKNKEEGFELEHRIIRGENGEIHYVYTKCDHEKNKAGKVIRSLGMIQDISQRKKYEEKLLEQNKEYQSLNEEYLAQNEELNKNMDSLRKAYQELQIAREKAEESDRLKTAFLNNISHEIRTPMNAIMGFANLLTEDFPEEDKLNFIKIINNNASQLIKIIDDVIDISLLESNKARLEKSRFSIRELFEDLYHTHRSDMDDSEVKLSYELDENCRDMFLEADRQKIRQIMSGFISNALKYTDKGQVIYSCTMMDDHRMKFFVKDAGIGILETEKKKVFNRFFRGESAQQRSSGGTGLGLSIAKELVELMNGEIGVDSTPAKGSVFFFIIPFTPGKAETEAMETEEKEEMLKHLSNLRVLIVEDEQASQDYLKIIMSSFTKFIDTAASGKKAIEMSENKKYDLVMMDIKMPEMDGITATKILKASQKNVKIIMQTAYAQEAEKVKAFEAGCDDYLLKPLKKDDLINAMNTLWKNSAS